MQLHIRDLLLSEIINIITGIDVREGIDFTQDLVNVLVICFTTLISFAILINILHFWYMKRLRRRLLAEPDTEAKPRKGPPTKAEAGKGAADTKSPNKATEEVNVIASKAPKTPGAAPPEAKPAGKDASKGPAKAPAKAPAKPK